MNGKEKEVGVFHKPPLSSLLCVSDFDASESDARSRASIEWYE
jgi:hypothetical protein